MTTALELLKPRDLELGPFTPASDDADEQAAGADGGITVDQLRRKVEALSVPPGPWKNWRLARDEDGVYQFVTRVARAYSGAAGPAPERR